MRRLVYSSIFFIFFLGTVKSVSADVINPDWLDLECPQGQLQVECRYSTEQPFGPRTTDGCAQYKDNPNYTYLTAQGSSFGGQERYCLVSLSPFELGIAHLRKLAPYLLLTTFVEVLFFFIVRYRSVFKLAIVAAANMLSLSLVYIATFFLPQVDDILFGVAGYEVAVLIFEYFFILIALKEKNKKTLFFTVLSANLITTVLMLLGYLFL